MQGCFNPGTCFHPQGARFPVSVRSGHPRLYFVVFTFLFFFFYSGASQKPARVLEGRPFSRSPITHSSRRHLICETRNVMMACRSSSGCRLKDIDLPGSGFILCGESFGPQNLRESAARIYIPSIRPASARGARISCEEFEDRCLLPVLSVRMRQDVLNETGNIPSRRITSTNFLSKSAGRKSSVTRPVRANSSLGDNDQSQSHELITNVLGLSTGLGVFLWTVLLPFLAKRTNPVQKFEEKVQEGTDLVDEVAKDVEKLAETTQEISERIEGETREDGSVHKAAELVDHFSKEVVKDAEIVERVAETVSQVTKKIDEDVVNAINEVEGFAAELSKDDEAVENAVNKVQGLANETYKKDEAVENAPNEVEGLAEKSSNKDEGVETAPNEVASLPDKISKN